MRSGNAVALVADLPPNTAVGCLFAQLHDGPDGMFAVGEMVKRADLAFGQRRSRCGSRTVALGDAGVSIPSPSTIYARNGHTTCNGPVRTAA
jgi:hypothetical protein